MYKVIGPNVVVKKSPQFLNIRGPSGPWYVAYFKPIVWLFVYMTTSAHESAYRLLKMQVRYILLNQAGCGPLRE